MKPKLAVGPLAVRLGVSPRRYMDTQELIAHIHRLLKKAVPNDSIVGAHAEACEFLRVYAGPKSEFLQTLKNLNPRNFSEEYAAQMVRSVLKAYLSHVEAGLHQQLSPERRAQIDVVSDFLEQAQRLLDTKDIHPAAPIVLIGAALEEFLRNWIEAEELSIGNQKPGLDAYAKTLRDRDLITKQDVKDLTSWAGLRNHAAHGEWGEVNDKTRASLMLEGINLFMRKYTAGSN